MIGLLDVRALERVFPVRQGTFAAPVREVRAVNGVDFGVAQGESMGICGESGCGKTTLAYMLVGLLVPTSGAILFRSRLLEREDGDSKIVDLAQAARREWRCLRREIQIVFQSPEASINPRRTIQAAVADPLLIHRLTSRRLARRRVAELLATVGLEPDIARRFPSALSAGQRQRVGIARALAVAPRLLVCDEPVSSLDSSVRAEILNLLVDLRAGRGLTYVLIAHDLSVLRSATDRIAVMYRGRFVEQAPVSALFSRPRHPYTERLLLSMPRLDAVFRDVLAPGPRGGGNALTAGEGCGYRWDCGYAEPGCEEAEPRPRDVETGHVVACHRADSLVLRTPEQP